MYTIYTPKEPSLGGSQHKNVRRSACSKETYKYKSQQSIHLIPLANRCICWFNIAMEYPHFFIGNTSSEGPLSIDMLDYRSVTKKNLHGNIPRTVNNMVLMALTQPSNNMEQLQVTGHSNNFLILECLHFNQNMVMF